MIRIIVTALTMLSLVMAQVPAHATLLNPNTGTLRFWVLHLEDVVVCVGRSFPGSFSRSNDGGRTWHLLDQVMTPFPIEDASADGDLIAVVGTNSTAIGSGPQVVVSRDRGLTWEPYQTVGQFWQNVSYPDFLVEVVGSTICVFWTEASSGAVRMQRSSDQGLTWLTTPITLGVIPPPSPAAFLMNLHVVVDGATMHAFWVARNGAGVLGQHQVSTDGGATWLPAPLATPSAPPPGAERPFAVGNANLLLLGNHGTQLRRSIDGGVSWSVVNGLLMPIIYDVAVSGQTVVVVGVDYSTPLTWYIQASLDGGLTWQAPAFQATAASGFGAEAFIVGPDLYVNFRHGSEHTWSIVAHSSDLGVTWRSMQSDVNQLGPGARRNLHLRFGGSRSSSGSVHAYVGLGFTPRGVGTVGSGGEVPRLELAAPPLLGSATSLELHNALGATVGVLAWSLQTPLPQPLAGGTLWLQPPVFSFVTSLGGTAGVPGAGTFSQVFVVPNSAALAGTVVTSQAVVIDSQATSGLALSNAIEWFVN